VNVADLQSKLFGSDPGAEVTFLYGNDELDVSQVATPHANSVVIVLDAATVQEPSTVEDDEPEVAQ
jgi:hypothetical protein